MLYNEFRELTGLEKPSYEEYMLANRLYMSVMMNKQTFCKCWMRDREFFINSQIFREFVDFQLTRMRSFKQSVEDIDNDFGALVDDIRDLNCDLHL